MSSAISLCHNPDTPLLSPESNLLNHCGGVACLHCCKSRCPPCIQLASENGVVNVHKFSLILILLSSTIMGKKVPTDTMLCFNRRRPGTKLESVVALSGKGIMKDREK